MDKKTLEYYMNQILSCEGMEKHYLESIIEDIYITGKKDGRIEGIDALHNQLKKGLLKTCPKCKKQFTHYEFIIHNCSKEE